jgi:iron-sulfur cluster assembly accessory protein
MINVTEEAGKHLLSIMETQNKYIMLGVKGGGCAGFSYDWQLLDEAPTDAEVIKISEEQNFYVDNMSRMYLFGSTVDLKKDVFGTVLEVQTPAASSSCGCGESINFDMDYIDANMPPDLGNWD